MPSPAVAWLAGLGLASLLMVLVWAWAVRIRNASIVDVAWSASFVPLAWTYVALAPARGARSMAMLAMVTAWSLRLAWHLARRIARDHPREDPRYVEIRRRWGAAADRRFFWFFLAQAVAASVLSVPFLLVAAGGAAAMDAWAWAGAGLWLAGLSGEAAADRQLAAFRASHPDRLAVCDVGLWGWSRHPNYFFEWVIWCGFAVMALGAPWGWVALAAPAIMLYLLLAVTGVPAAEASSLARRGAAYRDYQRRVHSAFVPWPRRRSERV
jgi:steroid 5-alpha reductase family enzyme